MMTRSFATVVLAIGLGAASLSPALAAARHHAQKATGACAQSAGRCISNCDALNWCQMFACVGGQSTPVAFWRCYEPSGLCLAPHC